MHGSIKVIKGPAGWPRKLEMTDVGIFLSENGETLVFRFTHPNSDWYTIYLKDKRSSKLVKTKLLPDKYYPVDITVNVAKDEK